MCNSKLAGARPLVCERARPQAMTQGAGSSMPFMYQDVIEITTCL